MKNEKCYVIIANSIILLAFSLIEGAFHQKDFVIGAFADPWFEGVYDQTISCPKKVNASTTVISTDIARMRQAKDAGIGLIIYPADNRQAFSPTNLNAGWDECNIDYQLYIASQVDMQCLIYDRRFYNRISCNGFQGQSAGSGCTIEFNSSDASNIINHYTALPESKYLYGYHLRDEPGASTVDPIWPVTIKDWVNHFKSNDPDRLIYVNLLPRYGFSSDADYRAYVDEYVNDVDPNRRVDVIGYDNYLFVYSGYTYLDNLRTIREYANGRPFWAYTNTIEEASGTEGSNTAWQPVTDESYYRFQAFCPIAYGAKGLIYWTYETVFVEALATKGVTKNKYSLVSSINNYIKTVIGPAVMRSDYVGVFHKEDFHYLCAVPRDIALPSDELLAYSTPRFLKDFTNLNCMVAVFVNSNNSREGFLLVVNRGYRDTESTVDCDITLDGNFMNQVRGTSIANHSYKALATVFDAAQGITTFTVSQLKPGEGRLIRLGPVDLTPINYLLLD